MPKCTSRKNCKGCKEAEQKTCKKCDGNKRCHTCGKLFDNRGFAKSYLLREHGPWHFMCNGCAE